MSTAQNGYHRQVCRWLSARGISYMEEYVVGPYSLDIFLPELRRGVELDGPQHSRRADWERDQLIKNWFGINVVRVKVGARKAVAMEVILGDDAQ